MLVRAVSSLLSRPPAMLVAAESSMMMPVVPAPPPAAKNAVMFAAPFTLTKLQPAATRFENANAEDAASPALVDGSLPRDTTTFWPLVTPGARFSIARCMNNQPFRLAVAVAEP